MPAKASSTKRAICQSNKKMYKVNEIELVDSNSDSEIEIVEVDSSAHQQEN